MNNGHKSKIGLEQRNSYSSFDTYANNPWSISQQTSPYNHNRSLSIEGIHGASPQKFKHMSKKLFVDRKEILSVFGQMPGRYHGYQNDFPEGGTYKSTDSKFWNKKGVLDKNIVGGARVQPTRGFQAKRKINEIWSRNILGSSLRDLPQSIDGIENNPEARIRIAQKKVIKDLNRLKGNSSLPYLRESTSLTALDPIANSPYRQSKKPDFQNGVTNLRNSQIKFSGVESPYKMCQKDVERTLSKSLVYGNN